MADNGHQNIGAWINHTAKRAGMVPVHAAISDIQKTKGLIIGVAKLAGLVQERAD